MVPRGVGKVHCSSLAAKIRFAGIEGKGQGGSGSVRASGFMQSYMGGIYAREMPGRRGAVGLRGGAAGPTSPGALDRGRGGASKPGFRAQGSGFRVQGLRFEPNPKGRTLKRAREEIIMGGPGRGCGGPGRGPGRAAGAAGEGGINALNPYY